MKNTIQTTIYSYRFDVSKPEEAAAYAELCERLTAQGLTCFETWGGKGHYLPELNGKKVELETANIFDNQWNTAPIKGNYENGVRVFDWAQDYPINFSKSIKRGHYLEQTEEMREIRRNTTTCGYCSKQEPAAKGYTFCPHCLDSEYLKEADLRLTRMVAVCDTGKSRAPLTKAEREYLLPLYREAQKNGTTERGKKRIATERARIEQEYEKTVADATEKRDAARWIMDNAPGFLANWIFYSHTGKHCFGWRSKLDAAQLSALLEAISEFPFSYEIECADGRKLSGN